MTREEAQALSPGDRVQVSYFDNVTTGTVVEVEPNGRYGPQIGWVRIRHVFDTRDGTRYAGAEYEAYCGFMVRDGEPIQQAMSLFGRT